MGDVKPSTYVAGIVVFALIIGSGVYLLGSLHSRASFENYAEVQSFNATFAKASEVASSVESLRANIEDSEPDAGLFGVLNALINGAWQSIHAIFTSFGFMDDALDGLSTYFGIPAFMITLITALVTVMLVFAIWGALFQKEM